MLAKLMKYEIKATARNFLPIYLGIIIMSIVVSTSIFMEWNFSRFDPSFIFVLIFMALFIALAVMTLLTIIQRFYNNVLGDKGYLMFTLPVKSSSLILSKLLVSLFWFICSCLVTVLAGCILLAGVSGGEVFTLLFDWNQWQYLINLYGGEEFMQVISIWAIIPICMIAGFAYFISQTYLAMAIGQLPYFSKYRMPASFIAYFAIEIFIQTMMLLVGFLGMNPFFNIILEQIEITMNNSLWAVSSVLLLGAGLYLVMTIIMFFITNYILKKHLNLQ